MNPRVWLYQTPAEILIKASNGASDFGNKFGQPLICGSVLTFEHSEHGRDYGYDKVIMLAGGVGYADAKRRSQGRTRARTESSGFGRRQLPYRYGWRRCVSVDTGSYANAIELNAVQRANPKCRNACRTLSALWPNRPSILSCRSTTTVRADTSTPSLNSLKPPAAQLT